MSTFYISTTGNDSTGNGSQTTPWKSLHKATETVTSAGNTIHINAGTYIETTQCDLRVGVSIEGDGLETTIVKGAMTGDWSTLLNLDGANDTNGNQTITGVTFDGQYVSESNVKTWMGIWITGRSNVIIHDTKVLNFYNRGVVYAGTTASNPLTDPGHQATGNKFYNNIILNSATNTGNYGAGCLNIGGQLGMEIYNNTIQQDQRANFKNGWAIKYWENGFLQGIKIHDNTLIKAPYQGTYPGENGDWDFVVELFNISGLEIYNNTLHGCVDLNYNYLGNYTFSAWIHDNTFTHPVLNTKFESGIIFEFATQTAIVENNIFNNYSSFIQFNTRGPGNSGGYNYSAPTGGYSALTNNIIRDNLAYNIFQPNVGSGGVGIGVFSEGTDDPYIRNLYIYNNTIVAKAGQAPYTGIDLSSQPNGSCVGLYIKNNIIENFAGDCILGTSGSGNTNISTCEITNNDFFGNGGNVANFPGGNPTTYTNNSNLTVNPVFVGSTDFHLQASSPLINAGINVGLPFTGTAPDIGYAEFGGGGTTNTSPTANAGTDQIITLPTTSVTLAGSGNDADGTVASHIWAKVSGPSTYVITDTTSYTTTITGLTTAGVYRFTLTVTDNLGATATDDMTVTVVSQTKPTVNAGNDQTITLPTSSVTLSGSATATTGATITTHSWSKVSGTGGIITTPTTYNTTVTGLTVGTYVFQLSATDSNNATSTDTVQIVVNAQTNVAPVANAGNDQTITISATLDGSSSTDADGTITTYRWTKSSGPNGVVLVTPNAVTCALTGLRIGTYVFKLTVTDNGGKTSTDTKTLIINS